MASFEPIPLDSPRVSTPNLHSIINVSGIFPPAAPLVSSPVERATLSSLSSIIQSGHTAGLSLSAALGLMQRNTPASGNNNIDAQAVIRSHRNIAAQAAAQAAQAEEMETARQENLDSSRQQAFRRSSRIATHRTNSSHRSVTVTATTLLQPDATLFESRSSEYPVIAAVSTVSSNASTNINSSVSTPSTGCSRKRIATVRLSRSEPREPGDVEESTSASSPPSKKQRRSPTTKKSPPNAKTDDEETRDPNATCPICMCEPTHEEISTVNGCAHVFCFACIGKWADRENTCPLCKARFSKITRKFYRRKKKDGPSVHNTKRVKQRDQRSDIVSGAALEGLLASIAANNGMPHGLRGRFFVAARTGSGIFPLLLNHQHSSSRHGGPSNRESGFSFEQVFDSSSDEDDTMYPGLFNLVSSSTGSSQHYSFEPRNESPNLPFPFSMTGSSSAVAAAAVRHRSVPSSITQPIRSYAANGFDPLAGAPNNPLEIYDDSDSDSIEVVHVAHASSSF